MARPKPKYRIEAEESCTRCIRALIRRRGITDPPPHFVATLTAAWNSGYDRGVSAGIMLEWNNAQTRAIVKAHEEAAAQRARNPPHGTNVDPKPTDAKDLARIGQGLKAMRDAANANGIRTQ